MFESVGNYLDSGIEISDLDKKGTQRIQDWIDRGGLTLWLIFSLVIVSVYHVVIVLKEKDPPLVAWAIAIIADWGFFNFVSFILEEKVDAKSKSWIFTGILAVGAAGYSIFFHLKYYSGDILLALFIPFMIVLLAWVSHRQRIRVENRGKQGASIDGNQENIPDTDQGKKRDVDQEKTPDRYQGENRDPYQGKKRDVDQEKTPDRYQGENRDPYQEKKRDVDQEKTPDRYQGENRDPYQEKNRDTDQGIYHDKNQEEITDEYQGKIPDKGPDSDQEKNADKDYDLEQDEYHDANQRVLFDVNHDDYQENFPVGYQRKTRGKSPVKKQRKIRGKSPAKKQRKTGEKGVCKYCGKTQSKFLSKGDWLAHFKADDHRGLPPEKPPIVWVAHKTDIITDSDVSGTGKD